jgi:hypothetical protein
MWMKIKKEFIKLALNKIKIKKLNQHNGNTF